MKTRVIIIVLLVGVALVTVSLISALTRAHLPGDHTGYRPVQPIEYSHRVHAGELTIPCLYCHAGAEKSRHAGVPSVNVCMNCHTYVTASLSAVREEERIAGEEGRDPRPVISPELKKLFDAVEQGQPVEWVRVHKIPDFVYFDHRPHVAAGVACQRCHGPVEGMDRVRQFSDLTMGWCVDCHRDSAGTRLAGRPVDPSLDCVTCHF